MVGLDKSRRSRLLTPLRVAGGSVIVAVLAYAVVWAHSFIPQRVPGYLPMLPAYAALPAVDTVAPGRSAAVTAGVLRASQEWAAQTAYRTGIPEVAVRAYGSAELNAPAACHLGWTTLAGIGWIESGHGTHGGSVLQANGETTTVISGPPLAGGLGVARGPMQFIDDTWNRWASDGDGNGTADVNNINDTALTAARYLCAGGRDLSRGPDWAAAIYSYNHAQWYVDEVYSAADRYSTLSR